jgi:hypothetical protein
VNVMGIPVGVFKGLPVRDWVKSALGGNVPVVVTHAKDVSFGMTGHFLGDIVELPAPMDHWSGAAAKRHALAATVLHKGQSLVRDGHDQGQMLPHGPIGIVTVLGRTNRKNAFCATTVEFEKKPAACIHGYFWRMMACGDPVSLPMTTVLSNSTHTVFVGLTDLDIVKGVAGIIASMAVDIASAPSSLKDVVKGATIDSGVDPEKMGKQALANLLASVVVSEYSGWEEPIGTKVELSNPVAQNAFELTVHPKTGVVEGKYAENVASEKKNVTVKYEPGKGVDSTYEETPGHVTDAAKKLGEWL